MSDSMRGFLVMCFLSCVFGMGFGCGSFFGGYIATQAERERATAVGAGRFTFDEKTGKHDFVYTGEEKRGD